MKTAIVTDSGAYLSPTEIETLGVTVVPLTVIFGNQEFFENETISSSEFFERMQATAKMPTTAQAPLHRLDEAYRKLAAEGYDAVLSVHLSSELSGMISSLRAFVTDYDVLKVYVVDARAITAGQGYQVHLAARMLAAGMTPMEIVPVLEAYNQQSDVWFVVDDLSHLLRTGRISGSSAFFGNLLAIKPILALNDGRIVPDGKERTSKKALKHAAENAVAAANKIDGSVRFAILDANNSLGAEVVEDVIRKHYPDAPIDHEAVTPAVGVHTGEGVVGVYVAPDWAHYEF